jgi:hypothetical protein
MAKEMDFKKGPWRRLWSNFIRGKKINYVSREAEMYFWRLHSAVDDFGNTEAEPFLLHAATAGRRQMTPDEIVDWVNELASAELLSLYEYNGDDFLHIHDFVGWQPAGKNGKRVRRFPASPWDEAESANDFIHLSPQMNLRSQGESKYIQINPSPTAAGEAKSTGQQDDRGNPDATHARASRVGMYSPLHNQDPEIDHILSQVKGLEKGQFVLEGFERWKEVMGFTVRTDLSPERQKKLGERWHDTSMKELWLAIQGCYDDDFSMARGKYTGENQHNDIKLICKDRAKVEFFMKKAKTVKKRPEDKQRRAQDAETRWKNNGK